MSKLDAKLRKPQAALPKAERELLYAASHYLTTIGWSALVASVDRIQEPIPGGVSHELVIRFTGGKQKL